MITSLFAGLLGLLYYFLTMSVIRARLKHQVSLGYGENNEIAPIVSAHSNFISYVPFFLILLFLLESGSLIHISLIFLLGLSFFIGRVIHFLGFKGKEMNFKLRKLGMQLTLFPLIIVSVGNICVFLYRVLNSF